MDLLHTLQSLADVTWNSKQLELQLTVYMYLHFWSQVSPLNPSEQAQVSLATHAPFSHSGVHTTAKMQKHSKLHTDIIFTYPMHTLLAKIALSNMSLQQCHHASFKRCFCS